MTMKRDFSVLGVGLNSLKMDEVLELIITGLEKGEERYYIVTPNPEILVLANDDSEYKRVLNGAKLALVDGIGVVFAAYLLGYPIRGRVHGVDLLEKLVDRLSEKTATTGYLGAGPGVAEGTADCLRKKYPGIKIVFATDQLVDVNKMPKTDILFVALGSPKQEFWIRDNIDKLPVKVVIGVGGAFDFISGKVRRAPLIIRRLGLEWLFRLVIQPWRIKRQLSLIRFVLLVIKEKIS